MNTFKLMKNYFLLLLSFSFFLLLGCKKEMEALSTEPLSDYLPVTKGKYITYRLDSSIFTNFGTAIEVHSYQEKNVVDTLLTDNLGRPSYRVYRFLGDTAATPTWKAAGTYYVTLAKQSIEVIENNLRSVKLSLPIRENFSWEGNGFYPQSPYKDVYTFTVDDGIQDWRYTYTNLNGTFSYKGQTLNNVVTVRQANDSVNVPITPFTPYASVKRAVEKYAKGIGLVEQDFALWEYQFDAARGTGFKTGFGVKRTMIDHN